MEILNKNQDANLKVYTVWYNMYPGDDRSKRNDSLLSDPRVTQFWDEGKILGRWIVEKKVVSYPGEILWDAYLLYGSEAEWSDIPSPLISWGMPVYHRRHILHNDLIPLLEKDVINVS